MDKQKQEPRFVLTVGLDDVQLGRGRPVVTSEGNQRFRALILRHKPEYSSSNRHAHKDIVARKILSIISERGGKFLRKIESTAERKKLAVADGVDAWEVADEETSINKVKQALRENEASFTSADDVSASHPTAARKAKKRSSTGIHDATPRAEISKRGADSDSGRSNSGSIKSSNLKKKRKSRDETPISLADSIRANASKLGPDYSFFDSSTTSLNANLTTATATSDIVSIRSEYTSGDKQKPIDRSSVLENRPTGAATTILGDHPVLNSGSIHQQSGDLHESASQNDKESFVRRTIASALAVSEDENNSIQVGLATVDSRREDLHTIREGVESAVSPTASSSDDDKKPSAL